MIRLTKTASAVIATCRTMIQGIIDDLILHGTLTLCIRVYRIEMRERRTLRSVIRIRPMGRRILKCE